MKVIAGLVVLMLVAGMGGCVSEPKAARPLEGGNSAMFEVNQPPKQLVGEIRRIVTSEPISLPVVEEKDGVLVTGWEPHQGTFRIARHWQERTSYRIEVIPDWNEPMQQARVRVTEMTQERASDKEDWQAVAGMQRPQRAKELAERIESRLKGSR